MWTIDEAPEEWSEDGPDGYSVDHGDPIGVARGIFYGVLLALCLWGFLAGMAYLLAWLYFMARG